MGEVYRARDERLGRDVALKVVRSEFTQSPDRLARFQREAQLLASDSGLHTELHLVVNWFEELRRLVPDK
jgi:serine/threonine protein kinase